MAERRADVTWNGDLMNGSGTIDRVGSGAFGPLDVSWPARTEDASGGKTSPEELIAAAHASCFSMALAHGLAQAGTPPERLSSSAAVTFVPGAGITKIALMVRGRVPGLDADGFRAAAEDAKTNCPVSQALAGVGEITLDAQLNGCAGRTARSTREPEALVLLQHKRWFARSPQSSHRLGQGARAWSSGRRKNGLCCCNTSRQ